MCDQPDRSWRVQLFTLSDEKWTLRAPITITIEAWSAEHIARWSKVEAVGSGSDVGEAICDLKRDILLLHAQLSQEPKERLGRLPLRWQKILTKIVVTKEEHAQLVASEMRV